MEPFERNPSGRTDVERSQKSVTLDFLKIDKKTDRDDFERGYLLTNS